MTDFQINDYLLTKECCEVAREIFEDVTKRSPDIEPEQLRDVMGERAHEDADMHEWVIYNHKALMLCAHCDTSNGEEFLSDVGMPSDPDL